MMTTDLSQWLCDVYLLATILLAACISATLPAACGLATQPARRLALAWATAAGLVALMLLCALPGWSRWHLAPPAASVEAVPMTIAENPTPLAGAVQLETARVPSAPVPLKVALAERNGGWGLERLVLGVFTLGASTVVIWLALGVWQVRRLRTQSQPAPPNVDELLRELIGNPLPCTQGRGHGEGFPQVRTLANLPSAVAVGLVHPLILLPQVLVETTQTRQLRTVLAHELAHLQHRDLWLLAAVRGLLVLFWAHPLFWLWRRRVRLDQELLADTAAAELTSRADYAEELVALARQTTLSRVPPLAASVGLWETRSQLAQRVAVLLNGKMKILRHCTRRWRIGSLVALLGLAWGLSLVTLSPAEPQDAAPVQPQPSAPVTRNVLLQELRAAQKPNTIIGVCLDENGKPLSGVEVAVYAAQLRDPASEYQKLASTTCDGTGRFTFQNVIDVTREFPNGYPDENFPPRDAKVVLVVARADGRVPATDGADLASQLARNGRVAMLKMPPAQTLSGRVTTEQGQPVVGARVNAAPIEFPPSILLAMNSAKTDAYGEYSINDLEAYDAEAAKKKYESQREGTWTLSAAGYDTDTPWQKHIWIEHPDYARKRAVVDKIPGRVNVVLQPGAVLTGQVLTRDTDGTQQPAAGARLQLQKIQPADSAEGGFFPYETTFTKSNNRGKYRFESLPAGAYSIVAQSDGWAYQRLEDLETKSGETTAVPEVVLTRGGQVKIQLVDDATGKPLHFDQPTKAYVSAHRQPRKAADMTPPTTVEFTTQGLGTAQVPAGKFSLMVHIPSGKRQPGWDDADYSQIRAMEDYNKLPAVTVQEGEVVEVTKRMQSLKGVEGVTVTGTFAAEKSPALPDEEEEPKPDGTLDLVPSTPPAEEK